MLPIRGKQAWLFRLVAIPGAALLVAHVVFYRRFPWEANYQFPQSTVLVIAVLIVACWEVNLLVFRRLDRILPFYQNPLRRLGRQVLEGGLFTTLTFSLVFTGISVVGFGAWPTVSNFLVGLFSCFAIASIINGVYVGFYLLAVIYARNPPTADELNARLTELPRQPQPRDAVPSVASHAAPTAAKPVRSQILIETGSQILQVRPDEIAYFYSSGGIVQLVRADGRKLTTNYDSLGELANRLPTDQFFQISRQFVVHLNAVRTVRDDVNRKLTITLEPALSPGMPAEAVTISRYRSAEFRRWLTERATSGYTNSF